MSEYKLFLCEEFKGNGFIELWKESIISILLFCGFGKNEAVPLFGIRNSFLNFFRLRTSLFKPKTFLDEPEEEWVELCTGAETIKFTEEEGRVDKPELTS